MESKFNFLKTAFDDFYGPGNTNIKEYTGTKYTGQIAPTDQNVYVHDCFFQSCSSSSHGGAISCGSSLYKLLVEQTSFISFKTSSNHGGGIYFKSQTYGECILCRICGFNCSSTNSGSSEGQFAYTYTKNDVTFKNHLNDSSITHSLNGYTNSLSAISLWHGSILCPSFNSTNNVCYYYTALRTVPTAGTGSPTSETCCISYSSIVNNTANGNICIMIDRTSTSQRIDTCNIINNKQITSSLGIIYSNGNLLIKDSCIIGNDENNKIFYAYSSSYYYERVE
jgi:hypothetical protein